jgi:hypothetical protein
MLKHRQIKDSITGKNVWPHEGDFGAGSARNLGDFAVLG